MIPRLAIALAAALVSFGAALPPPPMTPAEKIAADSVRAHVEFLADDQLEGRDTGSRGHEIAARYVASRFREMGLDPGGPAGSWFVPVPLRRATIVRPSPIITMTVNGRRQNLAWGRDVALAPSLTERHRAIDAPLVFVGYGLDEPLLGLDDYRGLDTRGAIVVALAGTPPGLPDDIAAHLLQAKAAAAAAHGAIGLLGLGGEGRLTIDVAADAARTATNWVTADGSSGDSVLRARLSLSPAWQEKLFDRAPKSLAALRREGATASPRGFPLNARASLVADTAWTDFTSPEVIARLPGADPARAAEHIVVMAHLDHLGIKADAKPGEDRIYNGALDNAAGVATMIEAAREFVASGRRPARSILFIANTGEEKGLLGADFLAAHPTVPLASVVPNSSIVGVVDLDMPLPLYDFTDVTAFGGAQSTVGRTITQVGAAMGIRVSPDPMPQEAIFIRSDHYRFVRRGVPAILLMTGYANGGEAVWKHFLGSVYHTPADDLSQPILWRALARYAMLTTAIARALADAPDRPRWIAKDYFGDRFAPGQPRASPVAP